MSENRCEHELPAERLGDLIIVLLAGTLASLRDRMWADGYDQPARVVADLVEITDDYLGRLPTQARGRGRTPSEQGRL